MECNMGLLTTTTGQTKNKPINLYNFFLLKMPCRLVRSSTRELSCNLNYRCDWSSLDQIHLQPNVNVKTNLSTEAELKLTADLVKFLFVLMSCSW